MARLPRATYALMVALLPATATVIGVVVLTQVPTVPEIAGVALAIAGVAVHRERGRQPSPGSSVSGAMLPGMTEIPAENYGQAWAAADSRTDPPDVGDERETLTVARVLLSPAVRRQPRSCQLQPDVLPQPSQT